MPWQKSWLREAACTKAPRASDFEHDIAVEAERYDSHKEMALAFLGLHKVSVQEMTPKSLQMFVKHCEKYKDTTGPKVEFDSPCQIYDVLSL